jgi:hypothetical protein
MNQDIDVNILVQTFGEKISSLMNELVVKETLIKQLNAKLEALAPIDPIKPLDKK